MSFLAISAEAEVGLMCLQKENLLKPWKRWLAVMRPSCNQWRFSRYSHISQSLGRLYCLQRRCAFLSHAASPSCLHSC